MDEKRKAYQKDYRQTYKTRAKRVNLTLTHAEFRAFKRAAKGEATASFIKHLALAGLEGVAHIPEDLKEELSTLRFAIRNVANNVNQMARHSHRVQAMTVAEENNLLQHLRQLEQAVESYTQGRILKTAAGSSGSSNNAQP